MVREAKRRGSPLLSNSSASGSSLELLGRFARARVGRYGLERVHGTLGPHLVDRQGGESECDEAQPSANDSQVTRRPT
jgi:hypothetical protein